jgi:hypothetical protein
VRAVRRPTAWQRKAQRRGGRHAAGMGSELRRLEAVELGSQGHAAGVRSEEVKWHGPTNTCATSVKTTGAVTAGKEEAV